MAYKETPLIWKIERFTDPGRVVKDRVERELTQILIDEDRRGTVLSLTGPDVARHAKIYEQVAEVLIIAEIDRDMAKEVEKRVRRLRSDVDMSFLVHRGDVFDYVHQRHLPPLVLLDLDFTQGWTTSLEQRVATLARAHPEAWLRVTFNARSQYSFETLKTERELQAEIPYRAVERGPGDPMVTAQFRPGTLDAD